MLGAGERDRPLRGKTGCGQRWGGENRTRSLGLPSSTGMSTLHLTRRLGWTPQANAGR